MKMDEELQKRNTDCVYFLASPLTCKKGLDCEYRHNEMARLNPRDCWYWLAGNCVNPSCGFRHPPLDGHAAEAPPESEPSEPVNKTSIPCYFFFNGFCRKGSRCSFLHGPDGSASAAKSLMTVSENDDALPSGNKTSTGNDASSAPSEIHLNGSETASKVAVIEQKEAPVGSSLLSSNSHQSAFALVSQSDGQEATMFSSNPVIPAEGFVKPKSHLCTELNSEEETDDRTGPEERLESSPGFDVLVDNDNRSENLGYEDDPEYLLAISRKQRELNSCFLAYDYEKSVEYDPMYPKTRRIHDYNLLDDEHAIFNARKSRDHSRERMLDSLLSRKRKLLSMEMEVNEHSGLDLRNYLRKRRVVDDRGSQERPRNHSMGLRVPRFTSQVEKSYMESHERNRTFSNVPHQRERYRNSLSSGYRERYKGKRFAEQRPNSNEGSRKHISRERRSSQISPTFTRPKTLAEIKEEKKKVEQNGDSFGKTEHWSRRSADFEGPKPLTVILKGKRRLDSTVEKQY